MSRFPALRAIALLLFTVVKSCCATTTNLYFVFVSFFFFIKKPALSKGAGSFVYIFKKYQYGSLTPCLRKKTPPRKPYCICIFCHFINIVLQI
jgi:hypothetical protein